MRISENLPHLHTGIHITRGKNRLFSERPMKSQRPKRNKTYDYELPITHDDLPPLQSLPSPIFTYIFTP